MFFENRAVYEILWKNRLEPGRPQMKIWRMRIACWVPKPTNTRSEYALLIDFPLQHSWHEISSLLTLILTLPVLLKLIFNKQQMTSEVYALCLDAKSKYDTEHRICLRCIWSSLSFHAVCWAWYVVKVGQGSDSPRDRRYGDQIPVGTIFSTPVQTGPGAHPTSCTVGNGFLYQG